MRNVRGPGFIIIQFDDHILHDFEIKSQNNWTIKWSSVAGLLMHNLKTAFYISYGLKKIGLNYMTMKYMSE